MLDRPVARFPDDLAEEQALGVRLEECPRSFRGIVSKLPSITRTLLKSAPAAMLAQNPSRTPKDCSPTKWIMS
jgi:hypothetical protein